MKFLFILIVYSVASFSIMIVRVNGVFFHLKNKDVFKDGYINMTLIMEAYALAKRSWKQSRKKADKRRRKNAGAIGGLPISLWNKIQVEIFIYTKIIFIIYVHHISNYNSNLVSKSNPLFDRVWYTFTN